MKHAGNDIIDLQSPYVKGKNSDRRFVNRILTDKEQDAMACTEAPNLLLWAFWASKETAYKAVSKKNLDVSASPLKYNCRFQNSSPKGVWNGFVTTPVCNVSVSIQYNNDYIHCIGATGICKASRTIIYGIHKIDHLKPPDFNQSSKIESAYVRDVAINRLSQHFSKKREDLFITDSCRSNGVSYPEVYVNQKKTPVDLSLSHDGRFVAYAFQVNH